MISHYEWIETQALWLLRMIFKDCWTFFDRWSFDISPVTFGRNFIRFSMATSISLFSAISIDAAYNNSQTCSPRLRSFIMANLKISIISAAEKKQGQWTILEIVWQLVLRQIISYANSDGHKNVVWKIRHLWIRGSTKQPNHPLSRCVWPKMMLFKVVLVTSELSALGEVGDFISQLFTTKTLETFSYSYYFGTHSSSTLKILKNTRNLSVSRNCITSYKVQTVKLKSIFIISQWAFLLALKY